MCSFCSLLGDGCLCLAGFGAVISTECISMAESCGCKDALISESHLTLAFPDRVESWDLETKKKTPAWSMEIKTQPECSGNVCYNLLWQLLQVYCDKRFKSTLPPPLLLSRYTSESPISPWRLHSHKTSLLPLSITSPESQESGSGCRACRPPQCHRSCVHLGTGQVKPTPLHT